MTRYTGNCEFWVKFEGIVGELNKYLGITLGGSQEFADAVGVGKLNLEKVLEFLQEIH